MQVGAADGKGCERLKERPTSWCRVSLRVADHSGQLIARGFNRTLLPLDSSLMGEKESRFFMRILDGWLACRINWIYRKRLP